jgi:hypothetical protein|tara:strand:+ start:1272 stop:1655 length:384 start_codon:yes stop_codon:yes gene_type:complete
MESTGIQPQHLENMAKNLIGDYGWLFVAGLVVLLFQSSIKKLAASLFVFVGGDYKTDDVVFVDGKPARIIRVGFVKTVFFIYDVHEGKIVGGSKLVVQNEWLAKLKIEKPLQQLDLTRFNGSKSTKN